MEFQIGTRIDTNEPFDLDVKAVVGSRTYIAAITRYGKSWTSRKIVEEVFGQCGIVIIDPEGEYSSLREKYPFLIIGADVPIQIETAELMAEQVLKNGVSVIIDTSRERDDKEYVKRFLDQFFYLETTIRKPYLLVVEESEDYAPEKGAPGTAECLRTLIAYAKKGGKRGIGCIFIGHRPAWISKGILSQCSNKALGKIEQPDFKALENYARVPREVIEKLPGFAPGEFCFVGDWVEQISFVKVGNVKTTHLGMSPEIVPPSPKSLESVIANLQTSIREVVQNVKPEVESAREATERIQKTYEEKIEAIKKTADEKAERKYRVQIDDLTKRLGETSRSLTLQQETPISDVLEHPIVKARMAQLDQRAVDVLVKIERSPGLTREQLAAFLSASTNTVTTVIHQINRAFKAQAIIDDGGRPLKYTSMLKRLFLTDVGRREIDELNRLHQSEERKNQTIHALQSENERLRNQERTLASTIREQESKHREFTRESEKAQKNQEQLSQAREDNEKLTKEIERLTKLSKIGEVLDSVLKDIVKDSEGQISPAAVDANTSLKNQVTDLEKRVELLKGKIEELTAKGTPERPLEITVATEQPAITVKLERKTLELTDKDLHGRIAIVYAEGALGAGWFSVSDIVRAFQSHGWKRDPRISTTLDDFTKWGYFTKKYAGRKPIYQVRMSIEESQSKGLLKVTEI